MAVAIDAGEIVGFAGRRLVWQTNVVSDCYVDPARQGEGIGTRLLAFLLSKGGPVMTLASDDPKAHSLYRKWGMRPVVDCPYLEIKAPAAGGANETDSFPVPSLDRSHLQEDLGCRFFRVGTSVAAITDHSIESSVIDPGDDPVSTFERFLGTVHAESIEIQMSESHLAFASLEGTETFRDTLMATSDAQIPDPQRITFNGDLLAVGDE